MDSSNIYIEDNTITLPVLKNGVTRIGDLWDCHRSVIVGENLFNENLDGEYVNASPIETLDYILIHSRSTSEEMKTVKIGGEVSLELLSGLIAVKGGADYKNNEKKSSKVEKLICYYERETYSVFAQTNAKQVINQEIIEKILKKELRATHFVRTVTLGAEVKADIQVSSSDKKSFSDVSGDFFGKLTYGAINASIKATLGLLDSTDNTDLNIEINVHSKPAMKTEPKSIEQMFQMIENISTIVRDEKHFPRSGEKVVGVPIRFLLVPIKQFLNFDVEKLYIKMTEKVMQDFNEMLVQIHDYQVPYYISRLVLNRIPELIIILNDEQSELSSDIRKYEKGLRDVCVEYFEKSINTFKQYKVGKSPVEELLDIRNQFESKCNSIEIYEKTIAFAEEGEAQLRSFHSVDIQDSKQYVEVLTNGNKLKNFIQGDKEIKILLHTDHKSPAGLFLRLYQMAKPLRSLGCRLGVAVQAISPKFQLIIKVNGVEHHYDVKEDIPYILSMIAATVGVGFDNERLFHSLNAEILNTRLPFETKDQLSDMNNLIRNSRLKNSEILTIAKSHLETFDLLTRTDDRLKFFMPIDIIETSFQAIRNIPILLSTINSNNIDWIVGNLDIAVKREAGFLYIIKNTKVLAVCLDDYDLILLKERFDENDLNQLKYLSPELLDHSFYSERVKTTLLIIQTIESYNFKTMNLNSLGMKSFEEVPDQNVLNALELISALKSKTREHFIGILCKFALNERTELKSYLIRAGYSITDSTFNQNILCDQSKQIIIEGAIHVLQSTDPLAAKINIAVNILEGFDTIPDDKQVEYSAQVNTALDNLMNDKDCPKSLIDKIKNFDGIELKTKCLQVMKLLEQYENENENNNGIHLKILLSILNNESDSNLNNVLMSYINRINVDENVFGPVKPKLIEELNKKHFFKLIAYLSKFSHGIKYFIMHRGLEDLCGSTDKVSALDRLLTHLSDKKIFGENQWQDLWKNNRFLIIIRSLIENHRIPGKLLSLGCETSVPSYVPEDIAIKINGSRVENTDMALPDTIKDFDEFHEILKEMRRRDTIPEKFRTILADSITDNPEFLNRLNYFAITKKWKWSGNIFMEAIEMSSIESIVDQINEWKQDLEDQNKRHKEEPIRADHFRVDFNNKTESPEKISIRKPRSVSWVMPMNLVDVFGDKPCIISSTDFIRLSRIIQRPLLSGDNLKQTVIQVMPYILQKIKMWGCSALKADSISLLKTDRLDESWKKAVTKRPRFGGKPQTNKEISEQNMKTEEKTPLSRIDTIVGVLNNVNAIVGQDVLNIMAKFPLAIPLIIRSIYEKDKYKVLIPWLTQPIIKWESSPGKIVENHLFTDKFKMIVTLRIGDVKRGKCGKSTILNQLFSEKNLFSCCGEPGAKNNRPVTLEGTAEMVWLSQETSSNTLWESSLLDHYKSGKNELILLVNLHGDALQFPDHLNFFKSMASAYILFIMPENIDDLGSQFTKVEEMLDLEPESDKLSYIAIDPYDNDKYSEELIIETSKIHDDSNIAKLRRVLKNSIKQNTNKFKINSIQDLGLLELTESIETDLSNELINFVEQHSCKNVKKNMSLQKVTGNNALSECARIWKENNLLNQLIIMMGNILKLDIDSRQKAIVQLERELGIISSRESATVRGEYRFAQQEYQKTIGARSEDKVTLNQWRIKINQALNKMDSISLGLENFFRELGKLYDISLLKNPENNPYSVLAISYAELLIAGQAVELLDGDSSSITGPWLTAICQSVYQLLPKLRIFVISILGLQSSGKSTLLNAMFASKFAVSVGRCTRGLFMRLLFLDEFMKEELDLRFDAILLIDTEGLGAPERQNEPDSEKKDRIMATFATGISHLTIINVLGEYVNNLTEILQIAIVSMARLEKVDISPDILMVQHLTERNSDKMTNATKQFSDALENAINIADKKDMSLGVRNSSCLKKLRNTISLGKLFRQFRPFKNGASAYSPPSEEYHQDVVALFNSIIETAQSSGMTYDFKYWSELVQIYWDSIKDENFMRFKDVKELQGFLDTSDRIFAVKESIESTFKEHSEKMKPLLNDSANKINKQEISREKVIEELKRIFNGIPNTCPSQPLCDFCDNVLKIQRDLYSNVKGKPNELDVKTTIQKYISKIREYYIKHLSQKLSAVAVRQIESDENFRKIEKRLKNELTNKSKFNELDIQKITIEIWNELERDANEKVTQISVITQIEEEIVSVYQESPTFPSEIRHVKINSLEKIPAIDLSPLEKLGNKTNLYKTSKFLLPTKTYELEGKLKSIANDILNNEKVDTYRKGMIKKLSKIIEFILSDLEMKDDIKLVNHFKWKVTIFAIQAFIKHMNEKQENWNKENNPLIILQNNKEKYFKWIGDKLRYGFGYYSDGSEAGLNLLQAIVQKALKAANDKREQEFKNQNWISSSAKIRLKYLGELVEDVKSGKLDRPLRFFTYPQSCIAEWYRTRLQSCLSEEELLVIFKETQEKLFDHVVKKLKELSTIEAKQEFIKDFVTECDGIELRFTVIQTGSTRADSEIFTKGIFEAFEREKKQLFVDNNINFIDLSKDMGLLSKLGCTESCPYCSAICWMPYGHDSDTGISKKHHTCHQPMGLSGIRYCEPSNELLTDPCHNQSHNNWQWVVGGSSKSFWKMIKDNGYENEWKFETHTENHFNQLMMWFFFKLHNEIANRKKVRPAKPSELRDYNMFQLGEKIDTIMLSVNDSVYRKN